jgi:ferrochelatase
MKYFGQSSDIENTHNHIGVLVANLGTPDAPKCPKLRNYLTEFLTDPRVIELPGLLRQFLVRGIIINIRSHKSAAAYRTVWTDEGSPLMVHSKNFVNKLQENLDDNSNKNSGKNSGKNSDVNFKVALGMRYGKPSIENAIRELHQAGCRKLIVLPMYPQYSGSTTGSIMDAVGGALRKQRWVPELLFINEYYDQKEYTAGLVNSIKNHWKEHGRAEKLVFSFHGIPQRYVKNGDPYQHQCERTVANVVKKLKLKEDDYELVYQSRVGREPWLQPYCDETMMELPKQGIKNINVICPGFSADCLETIEEIGEENKEYFMEAGGESYSYIDCLNSNDDHLKMALALIKQKAKAF